MPIPKWAATAILMAAQVGLGMSRRIKGPRLDDLSVTLADYGSPIPRFWGKRRLQGQVIWAEKLREKKTTSKTKGGKYQEYKYFGTWAVLICDHVLDDISRLWLDKHLVIDRTSVGPMSLGAFFKNRDGIKLAQGKNYRVYDGTQTVPDPRIEAWCEDRYGANTCPAYTGSAYIVFEEVPLEKFGNRIPQVTVEAINNSVDQFPFEVIDTPGSWGNPAFSADHLTYYTVSGSQFQSLDLPTREVIGFNSGLSVGTGPYAVTPSGIYAVNTLGNRIYHVSTGGIETDLGSIGGGWSGVHAVGDMLLLSAGSFAGMNVGVWGGTSVSSTALNYFPSHFFENAAGEAIGVGTTAGNVLAIGPAFSNGTLIDTTAYGTSGEAFGFDNGENYVVLQGSRLFLIDYAFNIIDDAVASAVTLAWNSMQGVLAGATTFWVGSTEYRSSDLSVVRTVDPGDWAIPGGIVETGNRMFDPVLNALLTGTTDSELVIRYLDRIDSNGVTLQDVVDDVSEWCGLTGQVSTALTQTVLGYSVTQGAGKDMLEPLLDIHDVDVRPHDFTVQFLPRGTAASGLVETADFVRNGDRYTVTVQQDTDLPARITVNFADEGKDQQTNTAVSRRTADAMDSSREETIDLSTYVDTPDGAQQKADRYLRRIWNSRERPKNVLTHQSLALEPGDVTTISLDGVERNVKLDRLTITPTTLECEFVRDEVTLSLLNGRAGAEMDGRDPEQIYVPAPTNGFVIDAPLIRDADNDVNPIIYFAAGDYNIGNWPGASVMRGDDGTYDDLYGYIESTGDATWGIAQEALADVPTPWLWDRGNTLDCTIYGTLTNATEAEIDADPTLNLVAIGADDRWEYVQFTTATLTGTVAAANAYTLSGFKRGRRGTEVNTGNHEAGDSIVLMSNAVPTEIGTDEIGNDMSFKIQTAGRDIDGAPANDLTYDGNTLRPYAPARVIWTTDGTDMFGEIIRRTRIGGSWTGGSTIPLGENSEEYEIDIMDGADVLRTITVSGTNLFTYTGAEITADGGAVGVVPDFNAYQMSDTAGRGFALAA